MPLTSGPDDSSSTSMTLSDTPADAAHVAMSAATSDSRRHSTRQRVLLAAASADEADRLLLEEELWEERDCLGSSHTA